MSGVNWALFLALSALWGSSFMWIKIAVGDVGPLVLVAWRLLFGSMGMLVVLWVRRLDLPQGRRTWINLVLLGLINTALPFVLISWGELTVDSAVASVLNSTVPLFTLLIAHFALDDDRMSLGRVFGLLLGFSGVLILMSRDLREWEASVNLLGQLAILTAALAYAVGGVFARLTMQDVNPLLQAFLPMAAADLTIWPLAVSFETGGLLPSNLLTWIALIWLGLLGSCLAYILYFTLLHRIGPTRATTVTYLIALVGVALGVMFLNERLDWRLAMGAALVVSGIALVNRRTLADGTAH